jgi:hypothetical protein
MTYDKNNVRKPKQVRPYFVKIATSVGGHRVVETRYGRWFASIDRCAAFAASVGGQVWVQTPKGTDERFDPLAGVAATGSEGAQP